VLSAQALHLREISSLKSQSSDLQRRLEQKEVGDLGTELLKCASLNPSALCSQSDERRLRAMLKIEQEKLAVCSRVNVDYPHPMPHC